MISIELIVALLATLVVVHGRTFYTPISYDFYTTHYSPISYEIARPMAVQSVTRPTKMHIIVPPLLATTKSPPKMHIIVPPAADAARPSKLAKRNPMKIPADNPLAFTRNDETSENLIKIVRRMRKNHTDPEMRLLSTIGLIAGALNVEEAMRDNFDRIIDGLADTFNRMPPAEQAKKMLAVEEAISRDRLASKVLTSALQFAREAIDVDEFQKDMRRLLNEVSVARAQSRPVKKRTLKIISLKIR